MRRKVLFIMLLAVIVVSLFGCKLFEKMGLIDETSPVSSTFLNENEAGLLTEKLPVWLYFTNTDNTELLKLTRYVPKEEAKNSDSSFATYIVNELIKGPGKNTGLTGTVPEGTALMGPVAIENGVATVDFNAKFVENHPGGKDAELMTVYSIVNTLTEMKEIQRVVFKIGGKAVTDFKGSLRFDAEFPRTPSLISDDPPIQETLLELGGTDKLEDTEGAAGNEIDDIEEDGGVDVLEELDEEDTGAFDEDTADEYIEILE
ncbi:MAG: GerMN domain-containing protein [Eubacteriales bacterium]|nr:GerMN domain-containing protein [Eubacteriales bacterium]